MRPAPDTLLRACVPTALAAASWWADVPGGPWLLLVGLLGGVFVLREDARAPITPWRRRFPTVPLERVERLPRGEHPALLAVCARTEATLAVAEDLPPSARRGPLTKRALRRELGGLVALAADLAAQDEALEAAGDRVRRDRVAATLRSVLGAVERLGETLRRASAPGTSALAPRLGALLTLERELAAHQDCHDELAALEAP